jgi:type VI secretion system secreted protein VgrG
VQAGKVTHKLKVGGNDKFEIYDYPGAYAQRFDGVDKSGGDQPAELGKIFSDNARTVGIRMRQEALPSLIMQGTSNVRHLVSGHKFDLEEHADANGTYVLTGIHHSAALGGAYRSGEAAEFEYENQFTCIPVALPFHPARLTPRPVVRGTHTATVVGPPGEEIFTDKYSRVKVQFHWDRENNYNEESSCWVRVGTAIAGQLWGMIHIPRIGQEVIVDFLEGDPDRPLVIGCVYHKAHMPPLNLPGEKTRSTIKSDSTIGGGGFNEIRFEDKKGQEEIYTHAQRNMTQEVENDKSIQVGRDEKHDVKRDHTVAITNNDSKKVTGRQEIQITGPVSITWSAGATMTIGGLGLTISVGGPVSIKAPIITLDSPTVRVSGVLQCGILNASVSVSSPSYTPGVGNLI